MLCTAVLWWIINQHLWFTIKPFVPSKYRKSNDIILEENGVMISDKEYVADIFNNDFSKIAGGLGFSEAIPNEHNDEDVHMIFVGIRLLWE